MPALYTQNLDTQNENALAQNFQKALESGDAKKVSAELVAMAQSIQEDVLNEAKSLVAENSSAAQANLKPLSNKEKSYYNKVISNGGFAGVEELLPPTVINRVFDNLTQEHKLLKAVNAINTTGITKWVRKKGKVNPAFWGKLTDAIKKKLDDGFEVVGTEIYKLSAYLPVAKAMLDLGPEWLDKYVRAVLTEASAIALEFAIVNGTGKDEPIGILKDLDGSVVDGIYPDKVLTNLPDLTPVTLGEKVMYPLTEEGTRTIENIIMIVNPADYWKKIYPATTILTQDGTYKYNVMPIPATIIQSVAMPIGKMAAGVGKDYFLTIGFNQKIEYSDDVKFIEDERVYATRMGANGFPSNVNSFLVFDISALGA